MLESSIPQRPNSLTSNEILFKTAVQAHHHRQLEPTRTVLIRLI